MADLTPDRKGLRSLVNLSLVARGESPIPPVPVVFANPDAPLRVEIEYLLDQIIGNDPSLMQKRNRDREVLVSAYLEKNYPKNPGLRRVVMDDLLSYQGYEDGHA